MKNIEKTVSENCLSRSQVAVLRAIDECIRKERYGLSDDTAIFLIKSVENLGLKFDSGNMESPVLKEKFISVYSKLMVNGKKKPSILELAADFAKKHNL